MLKKDMPKSHKELSNACAKLEKHFREPQDIEFTIEQGRFYLLQTRNAKMNAVGMVKTSVDMVKEKLINKDKALTRLQAEDGIRDRSPSRGLGDVYKRQMLQHSSLQSLFVVSRIFLVLW